MSAKIVMSASTFKKNWRVNLLRVQSGEDIHLAVRGKEVAIFKSELSQEEREAAGLKVAKLKREPI